MDALVAISACLIAIGATPLARRIAFATGILDRPGPLKVQREPVAYLGGLAVFAGIAVATVAVRPLWLVPLALSLALGVADDARDLPANARLAGLVLIGAIAGLIAPAPVPGGGLVTLVLVVVLANAINLVDGMDGLASVLVAISAFAFALFGGDGQPLALALGGALVGFLVFNRPPARIYLGDGGAYLLGTSLAIIAVTTHEGSAANTIAIPFLLGLPLIDAAIAIARRALAGRPLMAGDRSHVYDQLADRGWSVPRVLATCAAGQALFVAAGVLMWNLDAALALVTASATCAVALFVVWKARFVRIGALT